MNDITTAALWMTTFVSLMQRRWAVAGLFCGMALLVRPNLLPLGIVAGLFVLVAEPIPNPQSLNPRVFRFCLAVIPFGLAVLFLNSALYGNPFSTGYGQLANLFGWPAIAVNAPRYLGWLVETHTPFPLIAFAAPFAIAREKRAEALLACGLIFATTFIYLLYTPFDDWSYLRFLLPAITLMIVLASAVTVRVLTHVFPTHVVSGFSRTACRCRDDRGARDILRAHRH